MWIYMNNAFLSIVQDDDVPGMLLVRARRSGDIESVFPDAEACEAANRQAVKAIGDTDDVVIAFCIGGEE